MTATELEAQDRADMEQLAAGHDTALNRLMERHATPVFHFLVRMLGNEADANDLAQETFVRLYQSRGRFRAGHKLSSWLYTIAANLARNQVRWRSRHPDVSLDVASSETESRLGDTLPAGAPTPSEQMDQVERAQAVRAAVRQLPEDLREAIVLCEWEELSLAEAAAVLDTTAKAVESRLYRARQRLRDRLKQWL